jgi:hypothetical protein
MKKIISIVASVLIISGCEQARIPLSKEKQERVYCGNVKRIVEYTCDRYWENGNLITLDKNSAWLSGVMEFNPNEILMKEMDWKKFDYPNEPWHITTIKLDKSDNIIERYSTIPKGAWAYDLKVLYKYNNSGFETELVRYEMGVFDLRVEEIRDEYNCCIKYINYDKSNKVIDYSINEYDNLNREISTSKYNSKDSLTEKWVYKYKNKDKDPFLTTHFDGNNILIKKFDKRDDIKSNKIDFIYSKSLPIEGYKDIEHFSNGKVKSWHYINSDNNDVFQIYDENGKIVEIKIQKNNKWLNSYTWKYRDDGEIIEESESSSRYIGKPFFKKTTYYKLDSPGNWVEKYTIDSDGNVSNMAIREIEYYN